MYSVSDIAKKYRRSGNTSWILKAALNNPKCIIVVCSHKESTRLQNLYKELYNKVPWYQKVIRIFKKREIPIFVSVQILKQDKYFLYGYKNRSLVFDNSALGVD